MGIFILDGHIPHRHIAYMMTLREYRLKQGISQADFASGIGTSQSMVSKIESLGVKPSLEIAFLIEDVTGGAVPARSWVAE